MANNQVRSSKHLEFVRSKPCMVCGNPDVQAHHLLKPWKGERGMGMKSSDENVVPLCHKHHHDLHTQYGDELKFFLAACGSEQHGKAKAMMLWYQSPAYRSE